MTAGTHWRPFLLAFAFGLGACDGGSPSGPTPLPQVAPIPPNVTAMSPTMGSTVRPTPVTISETGFLAGPRTSRTQHHRPAAC